MRTVKNLENLLQQTKIILYHQNEKEKLKGEKFNIFSILKMENKENDTHSSFLAELLNPEGSHLKGNVFLKLFLETINNKSIDIETADVNTEKHIGARNDTLRTGGRIDIYIEDKMGNCICVENKIYAGDQDKQIERYCNHRKGKNSVYYLTLEGIEPTAASKGALKAGEDYHLISYKSDILKWLTLCQKESVETPILRESIRQYIILIQKLTSTLETEDINQLNDAMLRQYREANYIAKNFTIAKNKFTESIRQNVIELLKKALLPDFNIHEGNNTSQLYSQIWIKLKNHDDAPLFFGIESFSGTGNIDGSLFIGIFKIEGEAKTFDTSEQNFFKSPVWFNVSVFDDYEGYKINMGNPETISKLYNDNIFRNEFINHIVNGTVAYLDNQKKIISDFIQINIQH